MESRSGQGGSCRSGCLLEKRTTMKKLDLIARPGSALRRRSLGLALIIGTALPAASALPGCAVDQAEADAGLAELRQPLTGTDLTPTLAAMSESARTAPASRASMPFTTTIRRRSCSLRAPHGLDSVSDDSPSVVTNTT